MAVILVMNVLARTIVHSGGPLSVPMGPALVRWFSLNQEANLPTLFASLTLLGLATLIAVYGASSTRRRTWLFVALVVAGVGIDEAIQVHEMFVPALRNAFGFGGMFRFAWVVPYSVMLAIFVLITLPAVMSIPRRSRLQLFIAAGVFVAGAVGMEMVGGVVVESLGEESVAYSASTSIEETLEMTGVVAAIDAFLHLVAGRRVSINLEERSTSEAGSRSEFPAPWVRKA